MPPSPTNPVQKCIRDARKEAGFDSRDTAATAIPFSPETIGRHERGEIPMTAETALLYAEAYGRPDIAIRYCQQCPIGQRTRPQLQDRDLPWAAMRVSARLKKAAQYAERLEEIADDGIVDDSERADFNMIIDFLRTLEQTTGDVTLWAVKNGFMEQKKDRPAVTGTALNNVTHL